MTQPAAITAALFGRLAAQPHVPRVTWYGTGGARTELSTASLANWSAKVAGLLVDELGAGPGDLVYVALPLGWQSAPILLGVWWAGLTVTDQDDPAAVAAFVPDDGDPAAGAADEVFVVSGHPLGAPSRSVAAHQRDFTGAVLPQADRFSPRRLVEVQQVAVAGSVELTVGAVLDQARVFASVLGSGGRLLSGAAWALPDPVIPVLLGSLAATGSVVQVDPAALAGDSGAVEIGPLARSENTTHTFGLTVTGLPDLS